MKSAHAKTQTANNNHVKNNLSPEAEDKMLQAAIDCHRHGNFEQAIEHYQTIITNNPQHLDALQLLSRIAYSRQDYPAAEILIRRAIQINSKISDFHKHLGDILCQQNVIAHAKNCYKKSIKLSANAYEAHNNLGLIYHNEKKYQQAIEHFKKATYHNKNFAVAWNNYGNSLTKINKIDSAKAAYTRACALDTHFSDPMYNLGNLYLSLHLLHDAKHHFLKATAIDPLNFMAHNNLGCTYRMLNNPAEALKAFIRSTEINPHYFDALRNLASAYRLKGDTQKAFDILIKALEINPSDNDTLKEFSNILTYLSLEQCQRSIKNIILTCYSNNSINHQKLASASAQLLQHELKINTDFLFGINSVQATINTLSENALFKNMMMNTINENLVIEKFIHHLRRHISIKFLHELNITNNELYIASLIAYQAFNNEYVLPLDETDNLNLVKIETKNDNNDAYFAKTIIMAMYKQVTPIDDFDKTLSNSNPKAVAIMQSLYLHSVINQQLEQNIRTKIKSFEIFNNETSQHVRKQYEENPYPRWLSLERPTPLPAQIHLQETLPHLDSPAFLNQTFELLVAGCGTGIHPISLALKYPSANITAIDLSLNSLAYAKRMAKQYQCHNISFIQCDLLRTALLQSQYHMIESIGVLHHLEQPLAGLRALLDHLQPYGLMKIALYSKLARSAITAAKQSIKNLQLGTDTNTIRSFREQIINNPEHQNLFQLTQFTDFYSLSGCRDLLFHTQEQCFTIPELTIVLEKFKLKFLGFEFAEPQIKQQYAQRFPNDKTFTNLANWDIFENENPMTFLRMYQFYIQKA